MSNNARYKFRISETVVSQIPAPEVDIPEGVVSSPGAIKRYYAQRFGINLTTIQLLHLIKA